MANVRPLAFVLSAVPPIRHSRSPKSQQHTVTIESIQAGKQYAATKAGANMCECPHLLSISLSHNSELNIYALLRDERKKKKQKKKKKLNVTKEKRVCSRRKMRNERNCFEEPCIAGKLKGLY